MQTVCEACRRIDKESLADLHACKHCRVNTLRMSEFMLAGRHIAQEHIVGHGHAMIVLALSD
eukprot:12082774-Alexandrium_andersonii.AAC.1